LAPFKEPVFKKPQASAKRPSASKKLAETGSKLAIKPVMVSIERMDTNPHFAVPHRIDG